MIAVIITALFGIVSIAGGTIGYVKAGSAASIIAGGSSGVILLLCAYGMHKKNKIAAIAALLVSLALGGRFTMTYLKSGKVMPDVVMISFAALTVIAVIWSLMAAKKQ